MTGSSELAIMARDRFLDAAKNELAAFEKKEREFRKVVRKERAQSLGLPVEHRELNYAQRHNKTSKQNSSRGNPPPGEV